MWGNLEGGQSARVRRHIPKIAATLYKLYLPFCGATPPVGVLSSRSSRASLTRLQLDEVGRERQVQQQGRQRAEALAERSVEIAQAVCVPVNVRCVPRDAQSYAAVNST